MSEYVTVAPADLFIDEENPRIIEPNEGQHKALQAIAKLLGRKLRVLAADIVSEGTDPSTLPIVMPLADHAGRYVVLEGNRRLAALRSLENPESVAGVISESELKHIRRLSREYQNNPIESILCVAFPDRESARHWIELRHTGENLGAGVVPWGSDESARFRARSGKVELYSQVLDFLQHRGDLTQDTRSQIPVTSFKRLIEAPDVRSRIGVELIDGHLYRLATEGRVAKALMHVINDLTHGDKKKRITVKDIYTKDQRREYAKKLPSKIVVRPTIKSGQGISLSEGGETPPPTKKGKAKIRRRRDKLIPRDCILSIPNQRIHDIEIELRKLSLENHTNAVSVLFRVFMELSVDDYIETNDLALPKDPKLRAKIQLVANELSSRKKLTKKQLSPVRTAIQRDSLLAPSVTTMHEYIHNAYVFPSPSDLRASWNNLQPFFTAIWSPQ